jgi:PhnB protein
VTRDAAENYKCKGEMRMVIPYVVFIGNCKDALEFYEIVFKSKVKMALPYGEYVPEGIITPPENLNELILHAEMEICGTNFWFADDVQSVTKGNMIRLTTIVPTAKEAKRIFEMLSNGGRVTLQPVEVFYSTFHAALTDKFGVDWNIVAEESPKQP